MFYSQIILAKKGPLGKIWLAAHWDRKLNKGQIFQADIQSSVESIVNPQVPLALRVSGHLLLGIVRIYSRKVKYLFSDCSDALVKIKMAFRPGVVDLPESAQEAAPASINVTSFGEFDTDLSYSIEDLPAPELDRWINSSQTTARRQDITLADPVQDLSKDRRSSLFGEFGAEDSFGGGGDDWQAFDPDNDGFEPDMSSSNVSDIEQAREADPMDVSTRRLSALEGINEENEIIKPIEDDEKKDSTESTDVPNQSLEFEEDVNISMAVDAPPPDDLSTLSMEKNQSAEDEEIDLSFVPPSPDVGDHRLSTSRQSLDMTLTPDIRVKRKRKRKVGRDEVTELTSAAIKKSLSDTSDIVKIHNPVAKRNKVSYWAQDDKPLDVLIRVPSMPNLSTELLAIFQMTMSQPRLPFALIASEKKAHKSSIDVIEEAEEKRADDADNSVHDLSIEEPSINMDMDAEPSMMDDSGFEPMADESNEENKEDGVLAGVFEEHDDVEAPEELHFASVNDLQANMDEDNEIGVVTTHGHKWHPHTVKVMRVLRKVLETKEQTSYKSLTKNTHNRRTAAGCFFELLQLKTLDYINVNQENSFGDIEITKTERFSEHIPIVDGSQSTSVVLE